MGNSGSRRLRGEVIRLASNLHEAAVGASSSGLATTSYSKDAVSEPMAAGWRASSGRLNVERRPEGSRATPQARA